MASRTVIMPSLESIKNCPLVDTNSGSVVRKASQRSPPTSLVMDDVLVPLVDEKLLVPLSPPGKVLM